MVDKTIKVVSGGLATVLPRKQVLVLLHSEVGRRVTGRRPGSRRPITPDLARAKPRRHRSHPIVVQYGSSVLSLSLSAKRFKKHVAAGPAPPDVDQMSGQNYYYLLLFFYYGQHTVYSHIQQ